MTPKAEGNETTRPGGGAVDRGGPLINEASSANGCFCDCLADKVMRLEVSAAKNEPSNAKLRFAVARR